MSQSTLSPAKAKLITAGHSTVRLRFLTATSLFDGHDAAINLIRRLLIKHGVEVIHLGHHRSVSEIVNAAVQEDVDAMAISCYQGGHIEFYQYLIDQLKQFDCSSVQVFAGGGGVILSEDIQQLHAYGVSRVYTPEDGRVLGFSGIIDDMLKRTRSHSLFNQSPKKKSIRGWRSLSEKLTLIEKGELHPGLKKQLKREAESKKDKTPIIGITGVGGSGKSSLLDELIQRFRLEYDDQLKIALLAIDPSRQKHKGALLGDRIRMNAINGDQIFMRSMATRNSVSEIPRALPDSLNAIMASGFDLIIIETPGIGQGDVGIVNMVDVCLYVMTAEYGAGTQLEKLSILDYADLVAINKFQRQGSADALIEVKKQIQRNRDLFNTDYQTMPVFGTNAALVNDRGVNQLYDYLKQCLNQAGLSKKISRPWPRQNARWQACVKTEVSQHYLADIVQCVRAYQQQVEEQSRAARNLQHFQITHDRLESKSFSQLDALISEAKRHMNDYSCKLLQEWDEIKRCYQPHPEANKENEICSLSYQSLSGLRIPKIVLPAFHDQGDLLSWLMKEHLPGHFPYTAGVYTFKQEKEDLTRMFAGEGDAKRTNQRFKYLASHSCVNRISTAFDSVTLYGCDPDEQADIYGRIGNAGVSVATLDDMKQLYDGFDLCDSKTSVSMTINGPAAIILAMYFNVAIEQSLEKFRKKQRRKPDEEQTRVLIEQTLQKLRGTVQADILKEDQGQNTSLFSTNFALKLMADVQEYFIQHQIKRFYSISVSGYHIAEAGANPITQLAFTLANGFTYLEEFKARGMQLNDFAHRLSFFFSNGMDPEYSVIGRVARRIWAIALRDRYAANPQCQKLKYHIQTSGRSLTAQAIDFNDIRTTLQALIACYDNCNSLHTNARDEAITTPTEDSLNTALAIQKIIQHEWGLAKNQNPLQGAFIINVLTDLVEEAVLLEFERLNARGGVLGAMETAYQRNKIQEQSLLYEQAKFEGRLALVGVNLFPGLSGRQLWYSGQVARSTETEKQNQIQRLKRFQQKHKKDAVVKLAALKTTALQGGNVFAELMETVKVCTLGQITQALFEVGGQYRRNM